MHAHLAQIERVNPQVNAIVTLAASGAGRSGRAPIGRARARRAPSARCTACRSRTRTWSRPRASARPRLADLSRQRAREDELIVDALARAPARSSIGKTNTPEFGAGSQTFNAVFGATRNPYDLTKTCGGSSGGAAVALACGMLPIADGSDLGGSLRNPASFCNVVGFRPSPGRVPAARRASRRHARRARPDGAHRRRRRAAAVRRWPGRDARDPLSLTEPGERSATARARLPRRARRLEPNARPLSRGAGRHGVCNGARSRVRGRSAATSWTASPT